MRALELTARTSGRFRPVLAAFAILLALVGAGCGGIDGVSAQPPPGASVALPEEAHTRFDVLFARDIIDHSAQAVALSNLIISKSGVASEIVDVANRIVASSTSRSSELQALLSDWGFAPMTVRSDPPAAAPPVSIRPGEHPLASDADFRLLNDAAGGHAADVYQDLMIRQHEFTISAARDQLTSGSNPAAMQIAQSLIESQQAETTALKNPQR